MDFETLSDVYFHIETTNVNVSLSDYQKLCFVSGMELDRFSEFANIDELSYEVKNVECKYYNSSEFHSLL